MSNPTSACQACGQVDDHPKVHVWTEAWHNDCLPLHVIPMLGEKALAVREACVAGAKGADLFQKIQEIHNG